MNDATRTISPADTCQTIGNSPKFVESRRRVQTLERDSTFALDCIWCAFQYTASLSVGKLSKHLTNSQISLFGSYYETLILNTESGKGVVSSGDVVQTLDYYPFGTLRLDNTNEVDEVRKFTGHEFDRESNLTYANARYYDQSVGKWTSMDTASRDNPQQFLTDPQQLNTYSYARNNPLRYLDSKGEKIFEFSGGITAGPFGLNVGIRYEPSVGIQIFSSNSIGLGVGGSLKYDPDGTLDQTRKQGEVYVERGYTFVPGVGVYGATQADEDPVRPWSLDNNPVKSSGLAFGLEFGYSHSFVRNSAISFSSKYRGQVKDVATQTFEKAFSQTYSNSNVSGSEKRLDNSVNALTNFFDKLNLAQESGKRFDPFSE